jgi:hypothetical protein
LKTRVNIYRPNVERLTIIIELTRTRVPSRGKKMKEKKKLKSLQHLVGNVFASAMLNDDTSTCALYERLMATATCARWPFVVQYRFVLGELRVAHGFGVLVTVALDPRFAGYGSPRMMWTPLWKKFSNVINFYSTK